MAKEIVTWCEIHLNENEKRVAAEEYEVTADGIPYVIDLCKVCHAKYFKPFKEILERHGQPVTPRRKSPGAAKRGPGRKFTPDKNGVYHCDYDGCERTFSSPQAVGRHRVSHT